MPTMENCQELPSNSSSHHDNYVGLISSLGLVFSSIQYYWLYEFGEICREESGISLFKAMC